MASRNLHIADFAAAIADGTIPGAFSPDRTAFIFPQVVSENTRGASLVWKAEVRLQTAEGAGVPFTDEMLVPGAQADVVGVVLTESHQVSPGGVVGKVRAGGKPTLVRRGKNLGRANATNPATQALRDALGLYNAQARRAGKAAPAPAAPRSAAAAARQPPPMLVKKIGETRDATLTPATFAKGVQVQRKFNGVRLVAYCPGGDEVRLYSRTSGDYPGLGHIRDELVCNLVAPPPVPDELLAPPPGCAAATGDDPTALRDAYRASRVHLDGEVYLHGKSLRWISGQARREDDEMSLEYHVFDCFFPEAKAAGYDMASAHRQAYLDLFFAEAARGGGECAMPHVRRAENFPAADLSSVAALRDRFLAEGYEGAIVRKNCEGYRYGHNGYHSANLVKVKPKFDSEFAVVGYAQGVKGKDVGAVIWTCEVGAADVVDPADKTFAVVPKDMSYEERYRVFRCLGEEVDNTPEGIEAGGPARLSRFERDFRGRPLTVEYPEISGKTGKPVQAKALAFRTYESGPGSDPLRRLYDECAPQAAS